MKTKRKQIWVVDDDVSILEVVKIILSEEGYKVHTISNGQDVLTSLKTSKPDLILLDVFMSGIDGRDISKFLKRETATKNIPIIIMSADTHVERRAQEGLANNYLIKPFEIHTLLKVVGDALQ